MKTKILSLAMAAMVAACGGGGGTPGAAPGAVQGTKVAPSVVAPATEGTYSIESGTVTPDPATTADQITVALVARFSGNVTPAPENGRFTIQFTVTKDGTAIKTGSILMIQDRGTPGEGIYIGTGAVVLPPQLQGLQVFGVRLDPSADYTVTGTVPGIVYGSTMVN